MRMKFLFGSFLHNCVIHPMFPLADLCDVLGFRFVGDVVDFLHSRVDYEKYSAGAVKIPVWMQIKKVSHGPALRNVSKKS
jgi:hypothetical protein